MKAMKKFILGIVTVVVLLFQLISPTLAYADDEAPPPHRRYPKTHDTNPPALEPDDTVTPIHNGRRDGLTLLKDLHRVPHNTNVVIVGPHGRPLRLALRDVAHIIAHGDPVWCPAGQAPTPGANGCTASYTTLADLIANEGGNIAADGTIWITSGTVGDLNPITIHGLLTYPTWSNYALTLQGGWSGIYGNTSIGSNSVFSVPIAILSWNNDVTINNISVKNTTIPHTSALLVAINSGNITVSNSNFNNNPGNGATLAVTWAGNITVDNSNFSNNGRDGLFAQIFLSSGVITVSNSNSINNDTGAYLSSNVVTINNSNFSNNTYGVYTSFVSATIDGSSFNNNQTGILISVCGVNLVLNSVTFNGNGTDIDNFYDCPITAINVIYSSSSIISFQREGEFALDCAAADSYIVNLPNGDLVSIFCPVSGRARISRLDNTALPADLPAGYTYASAFSLDILQNNAPIPVITEGGYIKASFVGSSLQAGNAYSILYWDNGTWTPLKDFLLDENGNVQVFDLNPGVPEDTRKIISGVRLVTTSGSPRVEVSTNFPGIFVLAQH